MKPSRILTIQPQAEVFLHCCVVCPKNALASHDDVAG